MNGIQKSLGHVARLLSGLSVHCTKLQSQAHIGSRQARLQSFPKLATVRCCSTYDAYPKMEETPSPFRQRGKDRIGYKVKIYTGGPLPRPEGQYENIKVTNTGIDPAKRDQWVEKKALFGQNDYIDILGDGTIHPADLMEGPVWLRRFRGNELQRLIRRMHMTGRYLEDREPEKFSLLNKRMFFLYKKLNKRRYNTFHAGPCPGSRNRLINFKRIR